MKSSQNIKKVNKHTFTDWGLPALKSKLLELQANFCIAIWDLMHTNAQAPKQEKLFTTKFNIIVNDNYRAAKFVELEINKHLINLKVQERKV